LSWFHVSTNIFRVPCPDGPVACQPVGPLRCRLVVECRSRFQE